MRIQLTCERTFPVMQVAILGLSCGGSKNRRGSSFAAAFVFPVSRWCCCDYRLYSASKFVEQVALTILFPYRKTVF